MASNAVAGFMPSRYGFHFRNQWPSDPVRIIDLGVVKIPIGNTARGLCGGMVFAARDRFDRKEDAPAQAVPPKPGEPLFREIVDRQFDSFATLFTVPMRFWLSSAGSQDGRTRETVRNAWPEIKAGIDRGEPAMVGLVRHAGWNPLALGLGHQVVAYRYDETATTATLWIYDPNHPGDDDVRLTVERRADGSYVMAQSSGEALLGVLSLPFSHPG